MDPIACSTIRVDVFLRHGSKLLLFVREHYANWDPWWHELFLFLSTFLNADADWTFEPTQSVFYSKLDLSEEQKNIVLRRLQTAPSKEIAEHNTLRVSIRELSRAGSRGALTFFVDEMTSPQQK